eukprot:365604-Chlamydomonas_euryale.AAC.4
MRSALSSERVLITQAAPGPRCVSGPPCGLWLGTLGLSARSGLVAGGAAPRSGDACGVRCPSACAPWALDEGRGRCGATDGARGTPPPALGARGRGGCACIGGACAGCACASCACRPTGACPLLSVLLTARGVGAGMMGGRPGRDCRRDGGAPLSDFLRVSFSSLYRCNNARRSTVAA